jgi:hypothetical protein
MQSPDGHTTKLYPEELGECAKKKRRLPRDEADSEVEDALLGFAMFLSSWRDRFVFGSSGSSDSAYRDPLFVPIEVLELAYTMHCTKEHGGLAGHIERGMAKATPRQKGVRVMECFDRSVNPTTMGASYSRATAALPYPRGGASGSDIHVGADAWVMSGMDFKHHFNPLVVCDASHDSQVHVPVLLIDTHKPPASDMAIFYLPRRVLTEDDMEVLKAANTLSPEEIYGEPELLALLYRLLDVRPRNSLAQYHVPSAVPMDGIKNCTSVFIVRFSSEFMSRAYQSWE